MSFLVAGSDRRWRIHPPRGRTGGVRDAQEEFLRVERVHQAQQRQEQYQAAKIAAQPVGFKARARKLWRRFTRSEG